MKKLSVGLLIFLIVFLLNSCKKEKNDYLAISEVNFTVIDDLDQPVNGADITIFDNQADYEQAVVTLNFSKAVIVGRSGSSGNGQARLIFQPDKMYFILVTYNDLMRGLELNNVGISSQINPLPKRTSINVEVLIKPKNGNIIFYSTASNKIPVDIYVSNVNSQSIRNYSLTGIYIGPTTPTVSSTNVAVVRRDPGTYNYYAKSSDGCAWTGSVTIESGQTISIELSKCNSGNISFYTTAANDSLLPMTVQLNNTDSAGIISASRASLTCTDVKSNTLSIDREEGFYTYLVRSASGRCLWTGSFTLKTDDCIIIPVVDCEN